MRRVVVLSSLVLIIAIPGATGAQIVRGVLLDSAGARVDARVVLTDSVGAAVRTSTTEFGVFHLPAARAGSHRLVLTRPGVPAYTVGPLALLDGETTVLEVRLGARAGDTATVLIKERTSREWGRDAWARRRTAGKGVFVTGDELRERQSRTLFGALSSLKGMQLRDGVVPRLTTSVATNCVRLLVDGVPAPQNSTEQASVVLNRMIAGRKLMGVEIFRRSIEVPEPFAKYTQYGTLAGTPPPVLTRSGQTATVVGGPGTIPCGVINLWTIDGW
jgi:hypothetical protein